MLERPFSLLCKLPWSQIFHRELTEVTVSFLFFEVTSGYGVLITRTFFILQLSRGLSGCPFWNDLKQQLLTWDMFMFSSLFSTPIMCFCSLLK